MKKIIMSLIKTLVNWCINVYKFLIMPFESLYNAIASRILIKVISEPEKRKTSDGRLYEFIQVSTGDGKNRYIYHSISCTYRWFFFNNHTELDVRQRMKINGLLQEYRINKANLISESKYKENKIK